MNNFYDVIVIGAGAAGLMCAIESSKRSKKVLVLDHAKKLGENSLMFLVHPTITKDQMNEYAQIIKNIILDATL